ncbi:flagellar basal body P-ring protein FlgI [Fuchsiella alkaliacetigena]|uniref:flagellar basal body P-ring protein FlgI n=1 Tax=Fuchsiella alkaliacetigena TaxID=957042 RepID=UPI00200AE5D0|nr:flagellar basal body P-ring protein FlgI [Fuchsiella alkaliacetigena]MCK8824570.1 flagellar basal body P-ring protein FlgI [Fuchsiella alkaliacetigena]
MKRNRLLSLILVLALLFSLSLVAQSYEGLEGDAQSQNMNENNPQNQSTYHDPMVRIEDITRVQGVRSNQLVGYGLVVGLNDTGDSSSSESTFNSVTNMLRNFGIDVDPNQVEAGNVAAVMVTAELPPFNRIGDNIDLTVSSIGDAESLEGGTLLMTPLTGQDRDQVYVMGQGPVSIGGFNVEANDDAVQQNHPTVGKVPNGGIVEREVRTDFSQQEEISLILENPNFETARRIAETINERYGYQAGVGNFAQAVDAGEIKISVPSFLQNRIVDFIAQVNSLAVRPNTEAKVVINERTGTVVMGHNVRISTVSVSHGNLTITISTQEEVVQPEPFAEGETEVIEDVDIEVEEEEQEMVVVPQGSTISEIVQALNAIGATPRDTIAILQSIKEAGALHADLEII